MLGTMRNSAGGVFGKGLLGLLFLSFVVWGIGGGQLGSGANSVATVGDEDLSIFTFQREYRGEMERAREMLGNRATPELIASLNIGQRVVERQIVGELLRQESRALGLEPDDKTVAEAIRKEPRFQNDKGVFDQALFLDTLRRSGVREAAYADDLRAKLASNALVEAITADAPVSDAMVKGLYAAEHETRSVDLIRLPLADVADVAAPTDEQLEHFYAEHGELFMRPEYRSISYIVIPESALKDNPDKALAALSAKIQDMLGGGSTLEEIAKAEHFTFKKIEAVERTEEGAAALPGGKPTLEAAFGLDEGAQSQLLKNGDQYVMVQADSIKPAAPKPLAEVRSALAAAWKVDARHSKLREQAEALAKQLAETKDGDAVNALIAKQNASVTQERVARDTSDKKWPPVLLKDIFSVSVGRATAAVPMGEDYALAVVRGREDAKLPDAAQLDVFRLRISNHMREELFSAYLDYLRNKYHVTVHQQVLDALTAPNS